VLATGVTAPGYGKGGKAQYDFAKDRLNSQGVAKHRRLPPPDVTSAQDEDT
jgi:hypothetical protein